MLLEDVLSLRLSFRVSSNFRWIAMFPGRAQHNRRLRCNTTGSTCTTDARLDRLLMAFTSCERNKRKHEAS
jgi:hypothetical protein